MKRIFILLIKAYQKTSRIFFPRTCRFYPSCSQYTLDAVQRYGAGKGLLKAFLRIARCSPFFKGGYDPVK